jgi:hypothetical protein
MTTVRQVVVIAALAHGAYGTVEEPAGQTITAPGGHSSATFHPSAADVSLPIMPVSGQTYSYFLPIVKLSDVGSQNVC